MESIKKDYIELLELRNTIAIIKHSLDSLKNILNPIEGKIIELEHLVVETIQIEAQKEDEQNFNDLWDNITVPEMVRVQESIWSSNSQIFSTFDVENKPTDMS